VKTRANEAQTFEGYWFLRELPTGPKLKTAWVGPIEGEFDGVVETVERVDALPTVGGIRESRSCKVMDAAGRVFGPGELRVEMKGEGELGSLKGTFESLQASGPLRGLHVEGTWTEEPVREGSGTSHGYLDAGGRYSGRLWLDPTRS